ncbi:MAG: ACT domain-containing protein [Nitrospinaceae bacterium]|nr:ACT domain-containing protein [Nitrospinaceae bacterium]NIR56985.1 ACT domain-containing protein [Nitrospinaceae bacterium]NIS87442.1 ACT domain-containing protein [Nitrospinaceae bacterium]NIT84291.1 ACT domain-containing protein [Nitrospinaceae bacterium]NIU46481.1 ACT domain-containing protein [Nitrospinaceae bacterium]
MKNWFMLTLVGKDRPGIVAQITRALYEGQCNLGEASMVRLGGNFTVMLMVQFAGSEQGLDALVSPVCRSLTLHHHVDSIEGDLLHHVEPDVRITVYGADRAGIIADATGLLAEKGFNILNLESDVGGTPENRIYIMNIEGVAEQGIQVLEEALKNLAREKGLETQLEPIDTLIG